MHWRKGFTRRRQGQGLGGGGTELSGQGARRAAKRRGLPADPTNSASTVRTPKDVASTPLQAHSLHQARHISPGSHSLWSPNGGGSGSGCCHRSCRHHPWPGAPEKGQHRPGYCPPTDQPHWIALQQRHNGKRHTQTEALLPGFQDVLLGFKANLY